jgi:hypothetical protein
MQDPTPLSPFLVEEVFRKSLYDQRTIPPEDVVVLTIQGQIIGSLGNYVALNGKPKVGKTLFLSAMLASAYVPYDIWDCKISLPAGRNEIAYVDTEQSPYSFHKLMARVKDHMGMENIPPMVHAHLMRKFKPEVIIAVLERILRNEKISVMFIDGVLDLCRNFNDIEESFKITEWLKKITEERNIMAICVIHQSRREAFSIGHLGASMERYAESVMSITKDDTEQYITLKAELLRNAIRKFSPVTIEHDGNQFIRSTMDVVSKKVKEHDKPPEVFTETQHKYAITAILPTDGLPYGALVDAVLEAKGLTKIKAKLFIKHWFQQGYIYKGPDARYRSGNGTKLFAVKEK